MRNYNQKQLLQKHQQDERIRRAEEQLPRLREIRREIAGLGLLKARLLLGAQKGDDFDLAEKIQALSLEKAEILRANGYPADYLDLHYDCPLCKDTGYIGNEKCTCFRKAAVDLLYTQSNIRDILDTENFAHFSFDYYSSEITDPATGITSLESARNAYDKAWDLIEKFREEAGNLFIYGETGVGKTYLTHCIAKELLDRSFFVLYFTSFDLFDLLSKNAFEKDSESADMAAFVYDCDLLIIDDLGTELTNSFVSSQLFCCINERIMNKKSTIISTNLTLADFMEAYSERTFSRVTSNYTMLKLVVKWRKDRDHQEKNNLTFEGYERDSYLISAKAPRFGSGEAKGVLQESVRGDDLYLMVDVCNYSLTYSLCGEVNHMSPDDHFQDLKRIIAAVGGKARRVNVIMPFLYESRQHKRTGRESLDCALALQELTDMGVDNIITFDAHDPRVQNAIPLQGFETVQPAYQFVKGLFRAEPDLQVDSDHLMIISPDAGGTGRAIYLANVLGVDMGMFYKRRDYSTIIDGRNPIVAHEFLGADVSGKDMIIIDDMISSGDSMLEVAALLKEKGAGKIFMCSTFGLFTNGLERFDKAYENGVFDRLLTTNLVYQTEELLQKPYYVNCDMSKYIALIIDTLNHDGSISKLLNPVERINKLLQKHNSAQGKE